MKKFQNFGFSPDADFPCIYAEKALLNVHLQQNYSSNDKIIITDIDYGNNAINVVPKFCKVKLLIDTSININDCIKNLEHIINVYGYSIELQKEDDTYITLVSTGISAHSAHPDLGKNAISPIIIVLYEFFQKYNINIELLSIFRRYIHMQYDGRDLNIDFSDESR